MTVGTAQIVDNFRAAARPFAMEVAVFAFLLDKARDIGALQLQQAIGSGPSSAVLARRYAVFRARQLPHTRGRVVCCNHGRRDSPPTGSPDEGLPPAHLHGQTVLTSLSMTDIGRGVEARTFHFRFNSNGFADSGVCSA